MGVHVAHPPWTDDHVRCCQPSSGPPGPPHPPLHRAIRHAPRGQHGGSDPRPRHPPALCRGIRGRCARHAPAKVKQQKRMSATPRAITLVVHNLPRAGGMCWHEGPPKNCIKPNARTALAACPRNQPQPPPYCCHAAPGAARNGGDGESSRSTSTASQHRHEAAWPLRRRHARGTCLSVSPSPHRSRHFHHRKSDVRGPHAVPTGRRASFPPHPGCVGARPRLPATEVAVTRAVVCAGFATARGGTPGGGHQPESPGRQLE